MSAAGDVVGFRRRWLRSDRGRGGRGRVDRTPRLVLRRFQAADAPALARYRSEPEVARFQSWNAPVSEDAAAALVEAFARGDPDRPGWFRYAITLDDRLIGDLGVRRDDDLRQALAAVVMHLFDDRGLRKLTAECDARNEPSAALLRRVGFVEEGRRRAHTWIKGEWTDDLLFGLLATDPRPPGTSL